MTKLFIRNEQPGDYRTVEELTREAFWNINVPGCDEHYLAHTLRDHPDFLPELDYVAMMGQKLVGSIFYCRAKILLPGGLECPVLTFGPLSVLPEYQRQGVGSALIHRSVEEAKKLGFLAIFIYGDPDYYSRFGFRPGKEFAVTTADGSYHPALQGLLLCPGALSGISGRFLEGDAYHLDPEAAAAFDTSFPKKEKFITESQRRFAKLAGLPVPE